MIGSTEQQEVLFRSFMHNFMCELVCASLVDCCTSHYKELMRINLGDDSNDCQHLTAYVISMITVLCDHFAFSVSTR